MRGASDHVIANNNTFGIVASGDNAAEIDVSLTNSVASNNSLYGVDSFSGGSTVRASVDSSVMNTDGNAGLVISGAANVSLSRSVLDLNGGYGVHNAASGGGAFKSTGDNRIANNKVEDIFGPLPALEPLR